MTEISWHVLATLIAYGGVVNWKQSLLDLRETWTNCPRSTMSSCRTQSKLTWHLHFWSIGWEKSPLESSWTWLMLPVSRAIRLDRLDTVTLLGLHKRDNTQFIVAAGEFDFEGYLSSPDWYWQSFTPQAHHTTSSKQAFHLIKLPKSPPLKTKSFHIARIEACAWLRYHHIQIHHCHLRPSIQRQAFHIG